MNHAQIELKTSPRMNTRTFTVRSRPEATNNNTSANISISTNTSTSTHIQILNLILSISINLLIIHLFHHVSIFIGEEYNLISIGRQQQEVIGNIDSVNVNVSDNMWRTLLSPKSSWGLKSLIVLYNIITIIQFYLFMKSTRIRNIQSNISTKATTGQMTQMTQNICQVQILPWGVQISEYTRIYNDHNTNENSKIDMKLKMTMTLSKLEKRINEKVRFIPLENVVDVIVNEVILSYKVRNCVMFRIRRNDNFSQCDDENDDIDDDDDNCDANAINNENCNEKNVGDNVMESGDVTLIPAFSTKMLEMSYVECTQLWKGISDALTLSARESS